MIKFFSFAIIFLATACVAAHNSPAPPPVSSHSSLPHSVPEIAPERFIPQTSPAKNVREQKLTYERNSTRKVCQVTGDFDRERQQPTRSRTESRYGVIGTDLGASFAHEGKTFFLFGDTNGRTSPSGADSIAYSTDKNPEACLDLQFITDANGNFLPPSVRGVSLGLWEVPTGGFSAHGAMNVFFMTDRSQPSALGRSVLARSDDDGRTFKYVYEASRAKFIGVFAQVVDNANVPGLPRTDGQGVLLWGSGQYRRSDPYLAYVPLDEVEDRAAWKFFAGLDRGTPRWSENEADAVPLFTQGCLGELSIAQHPGTQQWMMFYNCSNPRGIIFRFAPQPWGTWSESQVLFNPRVEDGYCFFMHMTWLQRNCDTLHDPGRENNSGGEYAPSIISRFTTGDAQQATIYFLMSTWNPYQVVLMKSILRLE